MKRICREKADAFARNWLSRQKQPLRICSEVDLTEEAKRSQSLLLVGGSDANRVSRELAGLLPIKVDPASVTVDGRTWAAPDSVVQMIFPSPLAAEPYVMVVAASSPVGMYFWNPRLWNDPLGYATVPWD
jgi:hypothetical protein